MWVSKNRSVAWAEKRGNALLCLQVPWSLAGSNVCLPFFFFSPFFYYWEHCRAIPHLSLFFLIYQKIALSMFKKQKGLHSQQRRVWISKMFFGQWQGFVKLEDNFTLRYKALELPTALHDFATAKCNCKWGFESDADRQPYLLCKIRWAYASLSVLFWTPVPEPLLGSGHKWPSCFHVHVQTAHQKRRLEEEGCQDDGGSRPRRRSLW